MISPGLTRNEKVAASYAPGCNLFFGVFAVGLALGAFFVAFLVIGKRQQKGGNSLQLFPVPIKLPGGPEDPSKRWIENYNAFFCPVDTLRDGTSWGLVVLVPDSSKLRQPSGNAERPNLNLVLLDGGTIVRCPCHHRP